MYGYSFFKKPLSHISMQAMRSRISEDIRIIKTTTKLFVTLIMLDKKNGFILGWTILILCHIIHICII